MKTDEHLFIDGYNIIHSWRELGKKAASNFMAVPHALADKVRALHDFDGVRITIVFDGQGDKIEIDRPGPEKTLSLLFTPSGMTADAFIEQFVAQSKSPQTITVVTEDSMIRETISSLGAFWQSTMQLQDRIAYCERCQGDYLRRQSKYAENRRYPF